MLFVQRIPTLFLIQFIAAAVASTVMAQVNTSWVRRYNGSASRDDVAQALQVDAAGKVYATGYSDGGAASYNYATVKCNSDGDTIWVRCYDGPGSGYDWAYALRVDAAGNVYVTGQDSLLEGGCGGKMCDLTSGFSCPLCLTTFTSDSRDQPILCARGARSGRLPDNIKPTG